MHHAYDRRETLELLEREGVSFELAEHAAVATVDEAHAAKIPFAEAGAKNLFLCDDKRRAHYLVCLPDDKTVSLKEIRARLGSRRLSFAPETDLAELLGLSPGAVTPLGALNDAAHAVEVVLDEELLNRGRIAVHPCDNTATVLLATTDLVRVLRAHDVPLRILHL